jgi:hypothetical protein
LEGLDVCNENSTASVFINDQPSISTAELIFKASGVIGTPEPVR